MSGPEPFFHGGADLECLLGYASLTAADLDAILQRVAPHTAAERFYLDAEHIPHDGFPPHGEQPTAVGARTAFVLGGIATKGGVIVDLRYHVVSVSVGEKVLWAGVSPPYPQDDRLRDFYAICNAIVAWRRPLTAAIGSEPAYAEELVTERERYRFSEYSLSPADRADLLRWYAGVYLR